MGALTPGVDTDSVAFLHRCHVACGLRGEGTRVREYSCDNGITRAPSGRSAGFGIGVGIYEEFMC